MLRPEPFARSSAGVADLVDVHGIAIYREDHAIGKSRHEVVPEPSLPDL